MIDINPTLWFIGIVIGLIIYFMIRNKINLFFYFILCCYMIVVVSLTILPVYLVTVSERINMILSLERINLIPIITDLNARTIKNWLLNTLMFVPYGFLIPLSFHIKLNYKKIIFSSFMFSFMIELIQLFTSISRICDINDLIFNTLGGVIGYWIICQLRKSFNNE